MLDSQAGVFEELLSIPWTEGKATECRFNSLRSHLQWDDEVPFGKRIGDTVSELIVDLSIARNIRFHLPLIGYEASDIGIVSPTYFLEVWEKAQRVELSWPGMKRLSPAPSELALLKSGLLSEIEDFL